jgi:hypothetical protein
MGNTTSFGQLITEPASEKIFLAEIKLSESLSGWSLTGGQANTYETSYLNETVRLANGTAELIRKSIVSAEEDGVALTARGSIANVEGNAGSYWHDVANSKFYVHPIGSDLPGAHTITGFFWLYFGSKGLTINNTYYEPYISEKGVPGIKQSNPKLYWGVSAVGGGNLKLNNSRGYFDQIVKNFIWINKTVKILMGGDNLPYSEYRTIYTGKIEDADWTDRNTLTLKLASATFDLFKKVPTSVYSTGTYPNMDRNAIGNPIPVIYGDLSTESLAVNPTCIDTSYANMGATTMRFKFKVADHAISDIGQVYVDFGDGVGWQVVTHTSEDLTNAQFCIACTGPATTAGGANNSSAYRITDADGVKVTLKGKLSGTTLIEKSPGVVLDLISNVMGMTTGVMNSTALIDSRGVADSNMVVPILEETDGKKVIEKLCRSDLAFFDEDSSGLYRYRLWEPTLYSTYKELDDTDFAATPKVNLDYSQLYWKIRLGYHYNSASTAYRYHTETDNEGKYKYEREEPLSLNTYLRNSLDAVNLAQRLRSLMKGPTAKIKGKLKTPIIDHLIGEKVRVTMSRAPFGTSGGWDKRYFELSGRQLKCYPVANTVELFDIKEFGGDIGYWTSTDVAIIPWSTNWDNATVAQRDGAGYWSSTDGYCSTAKTAISLEKSLWW